MSGSVQRRRSRIRPCSPLLGSARPAAATEEEAEEEVEEEATEEAAEAAEAALDVAVEAEAEAGPVAPTHGECRSSAGRWIGCSSRQRRLRSSHSQSCRSGRVSWVRPRKLRPRRSRSCVIGRSGEGVTIFGRWNALQSSLRRAESLPFAFEGSFEACEGGE